MLKKILIYLSGVATPFVLMALFIAYVPHTKDNYDVIVNAQGKLVEMELSEQDFTARGSKVNNADPVVNVYELTLDGYRMIFKRDLNYTEPRIYISAISDFGDHYIIEPEIKDNIDCIFYNETTEDSRWRATGLGDFVFGWTGCMPRIERDGVFITEAVLFSMIDENGEIVGKEKITFSIIKNGYFSYSRFP